MQTVADTTMNIKPTTSTCPMFGPCQLQSHLVALKRAASPRLCLRLRHALTETWSSIFPTSRQFLQTLGLWSLLILVMLLLLPTAQAAGIMPYEEWLTVLQQSLTGPVAFSVSLIGIVTCGATLILAGGEISHFMRSLIYIILVMTLLVGANSLMHNLFDGSPTASVETPLEQETETQAQPQLQPQNLDSIGADPFLRGSSPEFVLAAATSATAGSLSTPPATKAHSVFSPLPADGDGEFYFIDSQHPETIRVYIELDDNDKSVYAPEGSALVIATLSEHPTYDPEAAPAPDPSTSQHRRERRDESFSWDDLHDTTRKLFYWHNRLDSIADTEPVSTSVQPQHV